MPNKKKQKGRLKTWFSKLEPVKRLLAWSKIHSMWGFFDIPIYDVISFVIREIRKDKLVTRANSIAFSFFLSLFPGILAICTLIPLLLPLFEQFILPYIDERLIIKEAGEVNIQATLLNQLNSVLSQAEVIPANAIATFRKFAEDLLLEPRLGLLSVGYILAIFFASNGMMQLMRGFEKSRSNENYSGTFKRRNIFHKRLIGFRLLFTLSGVAFLSILSVIAGNYIFPYLFAKMQIPAVTIYFLNILRWFLTLALFYTGISLTYRIGMATRKKVDFFSAGATLATFLSIASSLIFALYVDSFSKYNELYGSIGTIIVIMLWIQINAFILLIGFELNASIEVNKSLKSAKNKEQ